MVLRSIARCPALPAEIDQPLAEILRRGRQAVRTRSRLRRTTVWWDVAEAWAAMDLARRDIAHGVPGGSRVLVAVAVAANLTESCARAWQEAMDFGEASLGDGADVVVAGARAARRALDTPEYTEDTLAQAWIAVCGVPLLRVLAQARAGAAGLGGSAAAIRIAQRTIVGNIPLRGALIESGLARLACVDRHTMASWRAHGAPSPQEAGFLITAAECAEFAGTTTKAWRELSARGGAPVPSAQRRTTLLWDEAEVLAWVDGRGGENRRTGTK